MSYAASSSIREVKITNHKGEELDITNLVAEINVYEDMFSNVMGGNLVVIDAVGLLSNLPIIGQEKVNFQIYSSIWGTKKFEFFAYSTTNREIENYITTSYNINLVSVEAVNDKLSRVAKSYKGTQAQIVKSIFADYIDTTKNFSVENTRHNTSLVVPFWSVFETINWLAARSVSNSADRASFFFYENQDGFQFNSLDTLFQLESLGEIQYRDSNIASSLEQNKVAFAGLTIEDYEVLEQNDSLKAMGNGRVGTTLYTKDLTKNQYSKSIHNYFDNFSSYKHLNANPIVPTTNAFNMDYTGQTTEIRLGYLHDNLFSNVQDTFFNKEWAGSRISLLSQLNSTRLNISLPGHIVFSAGKTINLLFPKNAPVGKGNNVKDEMLSGKYLITSVRHNFQLKFHRVSMEVVKESNQGVL